jgi:hypothetical protein
MGIVLTKDFESVCVLWLRYNVLDHALYIHTQDVVVALCTLCIDLLDCDSMMKVIFNTGRLYYCLAFADCDCFEIELKDKTTESTSWYLNEKRVGVP